MLIIVRTVCYDEYEFRSLERNLKCIFICLLSPLFKTNFNFKIVNKKRLMEAR
jgi:hypothetical protein